MDERQKKLVALAVLIDEECEDQESRHAEKRRKLWTKEWLLKKQLGIQNHLMQDLSSTDPSSFRALLRMNEDTFNFILQRMRPRITRQDTTMRASIPAEDRLAVTLRFLATGMLSTT